MALLSRVTGYLRFSPFVNTKSFEREATRFLNGLLHSVDLAYQAGLDIESYLEAAKGACKNLGIVLDLRDVVYIGLHEVLNLILLGEFCQELQGDSVTVYMPRKASTRSFLSAFGFSRYFESWGATSSKGIQDDPHYESLRLLPITRIASEADVGEAAASLKVARIALILRRMFGDKVNRLADTLVSEICQNIPEHSQRRFSGHGYCAIQTLGAVSQPWIRGASYSDAIEIAIVDGGIGIKQSLMKRYPDVFQSEGPGDCIETVLTRGTPQDGTRDRAGLVRVMRAISEDFGASLRCRSVDGLVTWQRDQGIRKIGRIPFFMGTQFKLLLPFGKL